MAKKNVNATEALDIIQNSDEVEICSEIEGGQSISLQVNATRKNISLALKQERVDISYIKDSVLSIDDISIEIEKHKKLLELAEKLNRDQQKETCKSIERSSQTERLLQFIPENAQRTQIILAKTLIGILQLINFQSPNVNRIIRDSIVKDAFTVTILKRVIVEIGNQKEIFIKGANDENREMLSKLIKTMDDVLYLLDIILNSKINELKSSRDTAKTLEIL